MTFYQFGDYVFDSEFGRLEGPNGAIELRPKTYELLTYLIRHQDRILSKQDLLEAVWKDRVVVENVLLQSIREIRAALGDSPKSPKYLKNYPRKGYRWIYPETTIHRPEAPEPLSIVPTVAIARDPSPKYFLKRGSAVLALLVALAVIWWWAPWEARPSIADAGANQSVRLMLLPFSNLTGEADKQWVELGLMDMVGQALASADEMDLVPTYDVQKTLAVIEAPPAGWLETHYQRLRERLGGNWIIHTQVFKEKQYRLLYSVYDPAGDLSQYSLTGEDLIALADQMVRQCLALMRPGSVAGGLNRHFSEDADAMRDYGIGRHEMKKAGPKMAKLYFQASINRDADFQWARFQLAHCHFRLGEWDTAKTLVEEILAGGEIHSRLKCSCLWLLGMIYRDSGEKEEAEKYFQQGLALARKHGYALSEALANQALGNLAIKNHRLEEARVFFEKAREIHRRRGNRNSESHAIGALGQVAAMLEDWPQALRLSRESVAIHREFNDRHGLADSLMNLGVIHCRIQEWDACRTYLTEALALFEALENPLAVSDALLNLGTVAQEEADWQQAIDYFLRAIPNFQNTGDREGVALVSISLGECYAHLDHLEEAGKHLETAATYYQTNPEAYGVFEFHIAKALLLFKQGRYQQAYTTLKSAKTLPFAIWEAKHDARLALYARATGEEP